MINCFVSLLNAVEIILMQNTNGRYWLKYQEVAYVYFFMNFKFFKCFS